MAIALVSGQRATATTVAGSTVLATLTSAPTAGNLMVATCCGTGPNGVTGWTAPSGWTAAVSRNGNLDLAIFWRVVQGGDATSYTFTQAGATDALELELEEWGGFGTGTISVDLASFVDAAAALTSSVNPGTTVSAAELVKVAVGVGSGGGTFAAAATYNQSITADSAFFGVTNGSLSTGHVVTTATKSFNPTTATWTTGTHSSTFVFASFKVAAGAASATQTARVRVRAAGVSASSTQPARVRIKTTPTAAQTARVRVAGATGPTNLTAPVVTGIMQAGQTLATTNGTWTPSPTSYAYQWYRGPSAISGATSTSYLLTAADVGWIVTATVTATLSGSSTSANSGTSQAAGLPWEPPEVPGGPILAQPVVVIAAGGQPANTSPPTISGTGIAGDTLTATTGTWTGANLVYTYQWYLNGNPINGATSSTFTPTAAQVGTITVAVTATNTSGTATGLSAGKTVTLAPTTGVTFADRFSPRAKQVLYRVMPVYVDQFGAEFAGNWTTPQPATLINDCQDWLMSLGDSTLDQPVVAEGTDRPGTSHQDQAVYYPEGRLDAVVVAGTIHDEQFSAVTIWFQTDAGYDKWKTMRSRSEPVLWRRTYGDVDGAEQDWVRIGADVTVVRHGSFEGQPAQLRAAAVQFYVVAVPTSSN